MCWLARAAVARQRPKFQRGCTAGHLHNTRTLPSHGLSDRLDQRWGQPVESGLHGVARSGCNVLQQCRRHVLRMRLRRFVRQSTDDLL